MGRMDNHVSEDKTMRKVFVLSKPLCATTIHKRRQLNGKDINIQEMVDLLSEHGYNITKREYPVITPAKEYKGIKIGASHWGMIVWARDIIDNCKLGEELTKEGFVLNSCMLPVEKRRDK